MSEIFKCEFVWVPEVKASRGGGWWTPGLEAHWRCRTHGVRLDGEDSEDDPPSRHECIEQREKEEQQTIAYAQNVRRTARERRWHLFLTLPKRLWLTLLGRDQW